MKSIYGVYVARDGRINYSVLIVTGEKTIETRGGSRDVLKKLIGQRVAVIDTGKKGRPVVVGYVTIYGSLFCPSDRFDEFRRETMVPAGTKYDVKGPGKYLYYLACPIKCEPYELPADIVNHGRSYCEFSIPA